MERRVKRPQLRYGHLVNNASQLAGATLALAVRSA